MGSDKPSFSWNTKPPQIHTNIQDAELRLIPVRVEKGTSSRAQVREENKKQRDCDNGHVLTGRVHARYSQEPCVCVRRGVFMSYQRYSRSICSLNITVSVPRPDVPPIYAPLAVPFYFHLFLFAPV